MGGSQEILRDDGVLPPAAVLLRRPAVYVRHQLLDALRRAGFEDILPAHLGVFQHPGPDGRRPGVLALRTQASKQAMNHLLHQLEGHGYLMREPHPTDRRTRVVRLTERGWAALEVIRRSGESVETEWAAALGSVSYAHLARALAEISALLDKADGVEA